MSGSRSRQTDRTFRATSFPACPEEDSAVLFGAGLPSLHAPRRRAAQDTSPIVEFKNIRRSFGGGEQTTQVLRGVNLSVGLGEFVAILGTSGSGKSTALHIMGLLDKPTSGQYLLDGVDTAGYDDTTSSGVRNQLFGFVFQNFYLLPYASALDNVLLPGTYSPEPFRELRERGKALLERVGLGERMEHKPSQLSGGQQQRVALARALLNRPKLILADEPTGQLDSATSLSIMDLFREIRAEGTTVVVVTHDPETAAAADRRIEFKDGLVA